MGMWHRSIFTAQQLCLILVLFLMMTPILYAHDKSPSGIGSLKPYQSEQVLVKLRKGLSVSAAQQAISALGGKEAKQFPAVRRGESEELKRWWKIKVPEGVNVEKFLENISKNPNIEIGEPDFKVSTQRIPNDEYFDLLWGLHNPLNDADIDAPESWDKNTGSSDVIVAVIDTGVDYNHEDLAPNMWTNPGEIAGNGLDDDNNGFIDDIYGADFTGDNNGDPMDDHGHGTHCAGTISGVGNNGIGVTGVSWNARIMALKFLNSGGGGYVSDAIEAVIYGMNHGADIMSNSWGGNNYSQAMFDAISMANNMGILFVAAAGNRYGSNDHSPYYPQGYLLPNVISVAATDSNDNKAHFSSYGANTVHLGAPGVNIYSSVPTGSCRYCSSNGYLYLSGTSMATPHVSGAAALLLARAPSLTATALKSALMDSVDLTPAMTGMTISGGRLNIDNALSNVNYSVSFTPENQSVLSGNAATYTMTITALAGDMTLELMLEPLAPGLIGNIADSSLIIPANTSVSTTITVDTTDGMGRGSYPIQVAITEAPGAEPFYAQTNLKVLVPDFEVSATPITLSAGQGGSVTYAISLLSIDGFTGNIQLSAISSEPSLIFSLSPSLVTLPADDTVSSMLTVNSSVATSLATYAIEVKASTGSVQQSHTVQFQVVDLDLAMSTVSSSSSTIDIGSNVIIENSVLNSGASTANNFFVNLYLSTDDVITTTDTLLASRSIVSLESGESDSALTSVVIPSSITPNNYYIGAVVDPDNMLPEMNEANNALSSNPVALAYGVDLKVNAVLPAETQWNTGSNVSVNSTVVNTGSSSSGALFSYVGLYLSTDAIITRDDYYLSQRGIYNLGSGLSSTGEHYFTVPDNLAPGVYYLGGIADHTNTVNEIDEDNNTLVMSEVVQVVIDIDLQVTGLTPVTTTWNTGANVTVNSTVTNNGGSSSGGLYNYVGLYLSTDAIVTSEDHYLNQRGIYNLGAGQSSTGSHYFTVPSGLVPGIYYLGGVADRTNVISETNEDNNTLVAGEVIQVVMDIDLQATELLPAVTSWNTGTNVTVSSTITNSGGSSSGGIYNYAGLYLSTDAIVTTDDYYLNQRGIYNLGAGQSSTSTHYFTLPNELAPGAYYLGVIADHSNVVSESNESNNVLVASEVIQVIVDIDLQPTSVIPEATSWNVGTNVTVSSTVANSGGSGSGSFYNYTGLYLSTDAIITIDDHYLSQSGIYNLGAGQSLTGTHYFTVPNSLAAGTYYLGVIADRTNVINETDESNNTLLYSGTITIQ